MVFQFTDSTGIFRRWCSKQHLKPELVWLTGTFHFIFLAVYKLFSETEDIKTPILILKFVLIFINMLTSNRFNTAGTRNSSNMRISCVKHPKILSEKLRRQDITKQYFILNAELTL